LASRLPGILPPATAEEALTGLALRDIYHNNETAQGFSRPFRSPHHTASASALVGGGSKPRPGEVSLAHAGVLFLDELPEFSRHNLEALREPLESGEISISRARQKITYPARFQLIAAMNPCPCGYLGDPQRNCRCTPTQIQRYGARISGPLLDRIDMYVAVYRIPPSDLLRPATQAETSAAVRARVLRSREQQLQRQGVANSQLKPEVLADICLLGKKEESELSLAAQGMQLSARGLHRTLRVARTIADLAGEKAVQSEHISEALAYRTLNLQQ